MGRPSLRKSGDLRNRRDRGDTPLRRKKERNVDIIIHEYKRKADARGVALIAGSPTRPRRRPITRKDYAQGQGRRDCSRDIATNPTRKVNAAISRRLTC